jgi:hypothetical protein
MTAGLLLSAPVSSVLAQTSPPCPANPSNVNTLPGYSITAVACGLNFPTAMTFDRDTVWVTEEGTATSPPAVKEIDNMRNVTTMLLGCKRQNCHLTVYRKHTASVTGATQATVDRANITFFMLATIY